ncbi:GNAT family N-acetyltransferase [Sphingobacterium athyrii]|uniref:N-acetyltransferase n=1 Tax=Sphingobacterium athyrii TaxID=2152717 RepID=A0A363NY61_9SPHI|nr:GNAT family N-acetyltransferase [Sphingobacterium athyrii]PUV25739.1 N-acetyltransferase [Sphingobacterium athyrii]
MERTEIVLDKNRRGELQLFSDEKKAGLMSIAIIDRRLVVYHTEVDEAFEGRGFAKILLEKLVSHARENAMKIVPLCPYVNAQFHRHPDTYADVWFKKTV